MLTLKNGVASGALVLGLAYACSAQAQDTPDAASGNDIIVTARRTEERLQDVPISITVFNQAQISNRNVVTASDLAAYTPSLAVNQRWGPEKASFAIRGFTQDQNTAPSVGVYFADVVAPRAYGGTTGGSNAPVGSFMDLQNVQVLKGPQGTLFGRNTTGGAVLLVPNKPTDKLEGNIEGSVGDYDMWRLQGVLNVPLADTFKVRLAVDRDHRAGYMKSDVFSKGPKDYNDVNYFAARLGILADLTPDLENYTIATYSNSFTHGYAQRMIACNSDPATQSGAALLNSAPACDQLARQAANNDGPFDVDVNNPDAHTSIKVWGIYNTTTWKASDTLTIKNIASYQEYREKFLSDLTNDDLIANFGPGLLIPFQFLYSGEEAGTNYAAQSTFTEELQLQGRTADDRLNWQVGGYLENADPIGWNASMTGIYANCASQQQLQTNTCGLPFAAFGASAYSDTWNKYFYRGRGLYGQGTYKLTDQLSLTAGIRYTWDKVTAFSMPTSVAADGTRRCADVSNPNLSQIIGGVSIGNVVANREQCLDTGFLNKSSKPTWMIDLDYKVSGDAMVYAKWSRGYRAGSINLTAYGQTSWAPESVDAYEIGAKTSFNTGSVRGYFNISAFYNKLTNQQILAQAFPGPNYPSLSALNPVVNAGKSRIDGVEVDTSATFFERLKVDLGYSFLDTKLISLVLPPAKAPYDHFEAVTPAGGPLSYSPKHRLTLTATYKLPLPDDVGTVSVGATYTYTAKQFISSTTLPQYQGVPASNVVNANVNWDNVLGKPLDLAFFVTNLTNKLYPFFYAGAYNSSGFELAQYAPPRMFGFRARIRFGQ